MDCGVDLNVKIGNLQAVQLIRTARVREDHSFNRNSRDHTKFQHDRHDDDDDAYDDSYINGLTRGIHMPHSKIHA